MTYSHLDKEALEWWFAQPLAWRLQMTQRKTPNAIWKKVYDDSEQYSRDLDRWVIEYVNACGAAFEGMSRAFRAVAETLNKEPTLKHEMNRDAKRAEHRARSMKREDKSLPWNRR